MANNTNEFNMVGVDVSKLQLDIAFDGKQATTIRNDAGGYKQLLKHLIAPGQVCFVMEATGGVMSGHLPITCLHKALKEYRKRNASGAVCDDPRIAVGPGVLTEL
jgi:transposase